MQRQLQRRMLSPALSRLPVNEMFFTIQGEAHWAGTPSLFVRLQGCGVGCGFCDTKHTWALERSRVVAIQQMLGKTADDARFSEMSPLEIVDIARRHWPTARHAVLTGGEPCNYDLRPLCEALESQGLSVQVETSGTAEVRVSPHTWVTVSPKIDMPGGLLVREEAIRRANEIKHPVSIDRHLRELQALLARGWLPETSQVWLQPLSQHLLATRRCIDWCKQFGYRLSLQTHKYCGVR